MVFSETLAIFVENYYRPDMIDKNIFQRHKTLNHLLIAAVGTVLLALCACERKPAYRIAVSQCSGGDWREKMNDEMRREVIFRDDIDIDLEIVSAEDNVDEQVRDLRRMAAQHPDVILVSPTEAESIQPTLAEIVRSGIPVVVFDRDTEDSGYTAFVGADNTAIGVRAAKYARSIMEGPIKAIEIKGNMRTTPAQERAYGFETEASSIDSFDIVATTDAHWILEKAAQAIDSLVRIYPDANLVFAHNDPMAIGVSDRLEQLGIRHKFKVIGVDGTPAFGIQGVLDGKIDATIIYPTLGHEILRTGLALAMGDTVARRNLAVNPTAIDASNADMFMLEDQALTEETGKIVEAKNTFDRIQSAHTTQVLLLISVIVILLLASIGMILYLRQYRQKARLQERLAMQNSQLEKRKVELEDLNERLNEANRSKEIFFTNVSHDLRTPLTLINASVDRIAKSGAITAQQQRYIKFATRNARILTRLINQILDFNKHDIGRLSINLAETRVALLFTEYLQTFLPVAENLRIGLDIECGVPADFTMAIDIEKMERVIYNLLANSFKFTPEGGSISVSAHLDDSLSILVIKVKDTGRGMNPEELEHMFDRHFTTDQANPFGSGIGLAISKVFVQLHGGTITADSRVGEGTEIAIMIPVVHAAGDTSEPPAFQLTKEEIREELSPVETSRPAPSEDAPVMLVIDDNADIRALLSELFAADYEVVSASSGKEGIDIAREYVPDIIICDIMMPDMDGLETCRRLKTDELTSHIPVVMLTACAMDVQRTEGYANGADAYVCKPFDPDMLAALITSLLENRQRVIRAFAGKDIPKEQKKMPRMLLQPIPDGLQEQSEFYRRFLAIFSERISDSELSVEELADKMCMSRVQLYRKLKALTGYSTADLLRLLRLQKALDLLLKTEMSVSEVGYATGFASPSYFTKCYGNLYGETPVETRKRAKGN